MKMPKPPKDLWSQLDSIREQCSMATPPDDAFTTMDYARRYNVSRNIAYDEVQKLVAAGKVKKFPFAKKAYYVMAP